VPAGSQSALILQAMSGATDNTASMLLAKLRTGHSWAELVDDIHQSSYVSKDQPTLSRTITRTATLSSHPSQESDQIMSDGVDLDLPERRLSSLQLSIGENLSRTSHLVWKRDFHSTARQINLSANFTATASSNHESQEIPVQIWAIVPLIDRTAQDCFETVFKDARAAIESGTPVQDFCGSHVWLEALHNECVYQSAPRLSQLVANLIRRTQSQAGYDRITENQRCLLMLVIHHCQERYTLWWTRFRSPVLGMDVRNLKFWHSSQTESLQDVRPYSAVLRSHGVMLRCAIRLPVSHRHNLPSCYNRKHTQVDLRRSEPCDGGIAHMLPAVASNER
jgi:hypothetical protein